MLKWWHERRKAARASPSAPTLRPHSGCPMSPRAMSRATADKAILDAIVTSSKAKSVPPGRRGPCDSPPCRRASAQPCSNIARRAIEQYARPFRRQWPAADGGGRLGRRHEPGRLPRAWRERVGGLFPPMTFSPVSSPLCEARGEIKLGQQALSSRGKFTGGAGFLLGAATVLCAHLPTTAKRSCPWARCLPHGRRCRARCRTSAGARRWKMGLAALDKGDRVLLVTPPYDENSKPFPGPQRRLPARRARERRPISPTARLGSSTRW